ncbi:hypothetical protein OMAG_002342 [Candidatus Omnitrophus magneticus]|uniref:Uncharacterized protein n=1 Tax=Candidatus Omnitrophus magneticus TaxID=1609969 RepID=A0A0F0CQK5_9BACT|nr:hypothetical protein OMAG_002342 [Candidatus Omnitrophus magneticus]
MTPYQRILNSKHVSTANKNSLKEQFKFLNPSCLRKAIDQKIKKWSRQTRPFQFMSQRYFQGIVTGYI